MLWITERSERKKNGYIYVYMWNWEKGLILWSEINEFMQESEGIDLIKGLNCILENLKLCHLDYCGFYESVN